MKYVFLLLIISLITISGCINRSYQQFGGPSEQIEISKAEEYDPDKEFQFALKCNDEVYRFNMMKDAGYAYYDSEGKLIEYCGKYAKNPNLQKCEELMNQCPP